MRLGIVLGVAALASFLGLPSAASPNNLLESTFEETCEAAYIDEEECELVGEAVFGGLERPGVSLTDARGAGTANLVVANFYFSGRVTLVDDQSIVRWTNTNGAGGNRHSVISSDLGSTSPVLPTIVGDTSGGKAFKSGELQPGDLFQLNLNIAAMNAAGYVPLPNGDFLIGYHCYIHGSSQMNGFLLVDA